LVVLIKFVALHRFKTKNLKIMKKLILAFAVISISLFTACGGNAEQEAAAEKARQEAVADSIKQAEEAAAEAAAIEAAEAAAADTIQEVTQ